ncbi:MAG: alkaline phosphatase family protein [Sandaracinaceae bacterium]|nr:alkaline phosphatase family protein [Sandaracinaceae bacterium]
MKARHAIGAACLGALVGCGGAPLPDAGFDAGSDAGVDAAGPRSGPMRSLVIALDGTRPDALAAARTPHLDALIAGTWRADYHAAYTPLAQNLYDAITVSGPNHATIMTGATSSQHHVTDNDDVGDGDFETNRHYLRLLEEDDPGRNTAALFTWAVDRVITSGADFVSGDSDADNVDRVVGMLDGTFSGPRWPAGTDPDAIFLFLDDPDHAGHAFGFEPGVPEYVAELEDVDAQIGRILDALGARPHLDEERWLIVLTSDHGGFGTGHGGSRAVEHTIPFLVAGRDVSPGRLPSFTRNADVVPTVLTHHGVAVPAALTGTARGSEVEAEGTLSPDLLRYHAFDGDLADAVGGAAGVASAGATVGADGGRFGGFATLEPGATIELPSLVVGDAFSVTLWTRARSDGTLLGDLDGTGWAVGVDAATFGATYASATDRVEVAALEPDGDAWHFVAAVYRDGALATMYAGPAGGALRAMAIDGRDLGALTSPSPVRVGPINGDVDDLAVWSRALTLDEVQRLFAADAVGSLR